MKDLRDKAQYDPNDEETYFSTREWIEEIKYCRKWNLKGNLMLNPEMDFGTLFSIFNTEDKWGRLFYEMFTFEALQPEAVKMVEPFSKNDKVTVNEGTLTDDDLILHIDLGKVNSLPKLKSEIGKIIDMYVDGYVSRTKKSDTLSSENEIVFISSNDNTLKNKKRINQVEFKTVLNVGDLKRDGLTNEKVARMVFPEKFNDSETEIKNTESTIRYISEIYSRYNELVNGEYKKLTIP